MTAPVRLGFIGAGGIGNVHMQTFKRLQEVELTAVADTFVSLAEQRAAEHFIPTVHPNVEALLADERLDAVVIGVPNRYHAELAIEALKRGKHVLLEKPMSIDAASAQKIVETCEQTGRVLMMAHQMRWKGLSRALKERIDEGKLGHIYYAKTGWLRKKGIPGWGSWFTQKAESGGGPLIDIGVHMLDLTLYLMGNPRPIAVSGTTYAEFGPKKAGIGNWGTPNWDGHYDVEDLATAFIRMDNGATLSLEVSWAAHAAGLTQEPFVHLMGTDGGIAVMGNDATFVTHEGEHAVESRVEPLHGEEDRVLMSRHFISCIQEGRTPITSALSGYTNNLILDAIYESSRTGREVVLDWPEGI